MTREMGMLDVGTHCAFCRELDFLPFHCSECKSDFCKNHRTKESHYCKSLVLLPPHAQPEVNDADKAGSGRYFKSLLPEKASVRVKQNVSTASEPVANAKTTLLKNNSTAMEKLKQYFAKNGKIFNSKKSITKASSTNKLIQVTKMKRSAKGDETIPISNRVYAWCYIVEASDSKPVAHEVYINKLWPVGRALDSLASLLNVRNSNIEHSVTDKEKLFLYRGNSELSQLLPNSARVAGAVKEGDILYIVRGADTPINIS